MGAWAGPFLVAALLLTAAGALKAVDPVTTAGALRKAGLPGAPALVRAGGVVEVVIGVAAIATGAPVAAALVALSYALFTAFVVVALVRRLPIGSCGCFGKVDTPPSIVHVVLDLGFAGVAAAAAVAGEVALPDVVADQPLAGIPFLLLLAIGCSLVFLAFTALPKTMAAVREVAA